jgi:hypothetical protein
MWTDCNSIFYFVNNSGHIPFGDLLFKFMFLVVMLVLEKFVMVLRLIFNLIVATKRFIK